MIDFSSKDTMTGKDRLMALVAGQAIDRVPFNPFSLGLSARLYGVDRGEFYRNPELAFEAGMHLMKQFPWMSFRPAYSWADRGAWEFGGAIRWPDGGRYSAPFSPEPVITELHELDSLADPDPETAGMNPLQARFNSLSRDRGLPASLPGGTPSTISSAIVGKPNFLKWMIKYPEAVHKLQRKVTDFMIRTAELTIKKHGGPNCGVMCAVPMESNQLISANLFESMCKPYIKELMDYYISEGVKNVMVHLCGDHTANLPLWADIPIPRRSVFSIGHEMDLDKTGEVLGQDFVLAGNLDSGTLQVGSAEQVKEEVMRCLESGMKHPGGFVLMPSCEIPPEMPLENIGVIAEALFEHGYYSSNR
ncbi:MAG: uroporphyrinogen decarboxylase family protein [Desulfomonile tiedjei]|uniref:Uroporphyrinogen decarboxylase family protein n=1 Tax=Desulfomonile tiedjei TaxID=2358 RepID=A0A9D6VBJ0_9BACT|nr:uroporphyrinogen decarboxylase family protein [Desulfomonile tiedjei]